VELKTLKALGVDHLPFQKHHRAPARGPEAVVGSEQNAGGEEVFG